MQVHCESIVRCVREDTVVEGGAVVPIATIEEICAEKRTFGEYPWQDITVEDS